MNIKLAKSRIELMREYEKSNKLVLIAVLLEGKTIQNFVKEFIIMDKSDISDKILDIINDIIIYSKSVYESDKYCDPFDDVTYDRMLSKFKKFRAEPFGNNSVGLANAKYKYDILSGTLDKVHFLTNKERKEYNDENETKDERDSFQDYINSIPCSKDQLLSVLVNQKKDGTSVTVDYKLIGDEYIPDSAISRGKKDYGEGTDVSTILTKETYSAKKIGKLLGFKPKYIGVQYEMLISNEMKIKFEDYIGKKFVNNRSAVSGLLRRILFASKKERKDLKKFYSLVPVGFDILDKYIEKKSYYDLNWNDLYVTICETFIHGDIDMDYKILHGTKKDILEEFSEIANKQLKKRGKLNHAIDGLVMTILDKDIRAKMGRKNNINQFQVAYKFPEEGVKTIIRDLIVTTGNFGYKEFLLQVDPVILNGTTQFKAQLHSLNRFKKMDPHIGDEIILKLSGDVIPYGYKDASCRPGNGKKIKLPKHCECGAELIEENNKLRCVNSLCPYRISGSLTTFFTELNAKGIGESICRQLYDELNITNPADVLKLTKEDFKSLTGFKEAAAKAAMNTIQDILTKPRTVPAILSALSIDCLRASTATKILDVIGIEDLISLIDTGDKEKLVKIIRTAEGIDKNADKIVNGLFDKITILKELLSMITIKETVKQNFDKTIVISGIRNDEELLEVANANGYNIKDSGKKFDLLVIKDDSMMSKSKATYAKSKNIPIMTRSEFLKKYSK